ncbi:rhodanese-like domain-containing protein [Candidatus Pelagibacter sp.]|jgi:rhodanese-related sulfurtransferase|nr:rhodanese-like domain-containing protein [Candidatus Pelagibacter sp.]
MAIKSSQTLVSEALQEIKTISTDDAHKLVNNNQCNLIDIRDIRELQKEGQVEGANHIPRGMLEFWLDPDSAYFKQGKLDLNKEMVLFCAGGLRSALAAKSLKDMGFEKVSHIDGGFGAIKQSKFKII